MEMSGERHIDAPRAAVWTALNDPDVLQTCIPGCEVMVRQGDGFAATVKQKIGPVSATFRGMVNLSNVVEGESYTISGEGKGGVAGFAKGGADIALADNQGGVLLTYKVEAKIGGRIAQLGGRLIDGVAKRLTDQFFDKLQETLAPDGEAQTGKAG